MKMLDTYERNTQLYLYIASLKERMPVEDDATSSLNILSKQFNFELMKRRKINNHFKSFNKYHK